MSNQSNGWFQCAVDRKQLKELMRRSDLIPLVWLGGYGAVLAGLGGLVYVYWGTVVGLVAFVGYGAAYGFVESLRHEGHHRTLFRTSRINAAVHWTAGFLGINEPLSDRWLHTRHHTNTYETGIDPEIQTSRPPNLLLIALDLFKVKTLPIKLARMVRLAGGRFEPALEREVPRQERGAIILSARAMIAGYLGIMALSLVLQSWFPLILTFGARISGAWLHSLVAYTQHSGLPENIYDYRANTRTIYTNPVLRFLYWNMNYHIEHHMFPMVPFYNLPKLHALIKDQTPRAYDGFIEAWTEMLPALIEQRKNPDYFVTREPHPLAAG